MRRLVVLGLLATVGCGRALTPPLTVSASHDLPSIRRLVVMPVSSSPSNVATVSAKAPALVSRMLLEAATRMAAWSVVDAKKTEEALDSIPRDAVQSRAGTLAARLGADGTLVATIRSYRERVGTAYGVSEPASVSIQFFLVPAGEEQAVWEADYTVRQEPLAYNLWNLWGVVLGGPKWLTTQDLAKIGIDEAVKRLASAVGTQAAGKGQ